MNIAILGALWGDEGKGAFTHHFSPNYDWIVRVSGGSNCGHTIYRDGVKYVHNLMPSFDWRSQRPKAFLGSGMTIDLVQLELETSRLFAINKDIPKRVYVDPNAFLVLPKHKEEDKAKNAHIGSTNKGVGPAYVDKMNRSGFRVIDVINNRVNDIESNKALKSLINMGVSFKCVLELKKQMKKESILFEGAQGIMLDLNNGVYPYVSCGDATLTGIYAAGFHFAPPKKVYGVTKCYTTKVGEGPFPTELFGEKADYLRKLGNEYGATTGRPRRVGWLDLPALKYACSVSGITHLIMSKFDILDGAEIEVCDSYEKEPVLPSDFFNAVPKYIKVDGWKSSKPLCEKQEDYALHGFESGLLSFVNMVENYVGMKIGYISSGVNPNDIYDMDELCGGMF